MNLIVNLKQLWRQRLLVAAAAALALLIALGIVYRLSLLPPSLSQRGEPEAQGSIEILVDSASSPIADARRDLAGLTARAGVFAELMSGGRVIDQIAREADVPAEQIDVGGPQPLPGEAPGAGGPPVHVNPYGIDVAQQLELPIVSVLTRAPTVPEARAMAAAAPGAIGAVVEQIQRRQQTPAEKRVEFRPLGPAEAAPIDDALGKKMALAIFVVLLGLFVVAILLAPRLRAAWREADEEPRPTGPERAPTLLLHTDVGELESSATGPARPRRRGGEGLRQERSR